MTRTRERYGLLITALAPVVPQILGSAFNIWYNTTVIQPLLVSPALKQRFFETVVVYNFVVYPIGVFLWLRRIFSFRGLFHRLCAGSAVDSVITCDSAPPTDSSAMVCCGNLRCCLVFVHSRFYRRAPARSKST